MIESLCIDRTASRIVPKDSSIGPLKGAFRTSVNSVPRVSPISCKRSVKSLFEENDAIAALVPAANVVNGIICFLSLFIPNLNKKYEFSKYAVLLNNVSAYKKPLQLFDNYRGRIIVTYEVNYSSVLSIGGI